MARTRFIVKELVNGRKSVFCVYDVSRGSYPYSVAGFGDVAQDHPTPEAAADERDRVAAALGDTC